MKRLLTTCCVLLAGAALVSAGDGRTELSQADFVTGTYTIQVSGSYVLTEDVVIGDPGVHGIRLRASNVSIDLNGYGLYGPGSGSGSAIIMSLTDRYSGIAIANGTLAGWGGSGMSAIYLPAPNCRIDRITAHSNYGGILGGADSIVSECTAYSNATFGIQVTSGSIVRECTASDNGTFGIAGTAGSIVRRCAAIDNEMIGIGVTEGSVMSDCSASSHTSNGLSAWGGSAMYGSTASRNGYEGVTLDTQSLAKDCAASDNDTYGFGAGAGCAIRGCTAASNATTGIFVRDGGVVENCVARRNDIDGIEVIYGETRLVGNMSSGNGMAGIWIRSDGTGSQVQNNHLAGNFRGLELQSGTASNVVIKNTAAGNSSENYYLTGVNSIGPLTSDESNTYECANFDL